MSALADCRNAPERIRRVGRTRRAVASLIHCPSLVRCNQIVRAALLAAVVLAMPRIADAQSMPATTAPQQMIPSSAPATYPATYPSTSASSDTAYPSTDLPALGAPSLNPYEGVAAGPSPSDASLGAMPGEMGPTAMPYTSIDPPLASRPLELNAQAERALLGGAYWTWQILPDGLMYKSYLAGVHEPRMGSQWVHERNQGWLWDATLGGRVGLLRYGTENDFWPEGWQVDLEGAAFPQLDLESTRDLNSVDFRAGAPITTRQGPWEAKFGYYHLSSHLGDEYIEKNPGVVRINYVRESLVAGLALNVGSSVRLYSEAGWAFYVDGGAEPWEFQFGADVSSTEPTGAWGSPFFAVNAHLRQENDFSGNMTVQTGWQWRGRTGHLLRFGMQYFNGLSEQRQFYDQFEEQIGMGLWYDY